MNKPLRVNSDAIAPDTTGLNFYTLDRSLQDLLDIHLEPKLRAHIEPHLIELGGLAGGRLDECARLADRHTPILHQRDKFGRDVQTIEYHPAYRELEDAAFGRFGIHALSHRKGIMGWGDVYPAAFASLRSTPSISSRRRLIAACRAGLTTFAPVRSVT